MKRFLIVAIALFMTNVLFAQCISTILQPDSASGIDAVIHEVIPNTNGAAQYDFVAEQWTYSGVNKESRGLLKFDLSFLPSGATIQSALLFLYANTTSSNGYAGTPTYGTNNACYLERVTGTWAENTVTWNTQPTITTADEVLLPQSTSLAEDYLNIDITTFAQLWADTSSHNFGVRIDMIGTGYYNSLIFCSSDHPDSSKHPKLEICYTSPSGIIENPKEKTVTLIIYPNPATSELNMNFGGLQAEQVNIYNVDGKLLSETKQPINNRIDISNLANGVYIAEVKARNAVQRVRWVKM